MSELTRRALVERLALVGLAPMAAAVPAGLQAAPIAIPRGEYVLTRLLERELAGDASIRVLRRWSCRFEADEAGMVARGEQIGCTIEAPPLLAPLAEMERSRVVNGLFPALIDQQGLIVSATADRDADISAAVAAANDLMTRRGSDPRGFAAALGQTAARVVSSVPDDLFFPLGDERKVTREVPLGGSEAGSLTVTTSARSEPVSGLLIASERAVLTSLGGIARHARECWTLEHA